MAAAAQAPTPSRRRHQRGIVWPIILIGLGLIFLLQNLGYLSWQLWGQLWQFWPLILVLIGIELLLTNTARGVALAVILVLLAAGVAGVVFFGWLSAPIGGTAVRTFSQSLQGASQANVTLRFGAGTLAVGALDSPEAGQLSSMTFDGPQTMQPLASYEMRNGTGYLTYRLTGPSDGWRGFPGTSNQGLGQMRVLLAPDVPIALNVEQGASDTRLDLSRLRVTQLDLSTGASQTWIRLPEQAGSTAASVKGGASSIDVEIPQNVAAQIQFQGGLTSLNLDESRFPSTGAQRYRSPNYDSAPNRVDLRVEAGVSSVNIR